jgi:hypothetical protein
MILSDIYQLRQLKNIASTIKDAQSEKMNRITEPTKSNDLWHVRIAAWLYRHRHKLVVVYMCVFILMLSVLTISKPVYEWDLLAYMGNAMRAIQDMSLATLHEKVYSAVIGGVPADDFARLLDSPSRLTLSEDPVAFGQTIDFFYDARVVYIHVMSALLSVGIKPVFAFYFFSTLCVVVSYLLLTRLIPVTVPMGVHIVTPFVVLAFGLMYVARLATPDALAALCTIVLYFLLLRNRVYLLLMLFPLTIFIRTDLILLVGLFHFYFLIFNRAPKLLVLCSALLTICAYLVLNHYIVQADPWSSLIGYNFGEKPTHPAEYVFPITPGDYFNYLQIGILSFSYTPMVFVFVVFTIAGTILLTASYVASSGKASMTQLHKDLLFLFLSSFVYFVLHFLLFPVSWLRFFAAQYTLAASVVCWCLFSMHSAQHKKPNQGLGFLKPV